MSPNDVEKVEQIVSVDITKRLFHPALTIDREKKEVLVGLPSTDPYFDDKDKYHLNEFLTIFTNKGEFWILDKEGMSSRGLYSSISLKDVSLFNERLAQVSPILKQFVPNCDSVDGSDGFSKGGGVNPYYEVFLPIKQCFEHFVEFSNPVHSSLLSLWVMGTYIYPIFDSYPYIFLNGQKASGKTKVLDVMEKLVFNPLKSSHTSPSILFRSIHNKLCTILLDETEQLTGKESNSDLKLVLNGGYKRGSYVTRSEPETLKPQQFNTFSPKALASINHLDSVLASRCIYIVMLRTNNPKIGRSIVSDRNYEFTPLVVNLYRFTLEHALKIAVIYDADDELSELNNRANELFLPLNAIAKYLDGFSNSDAQKLLPLISTFANDLTFEDTEIDDWTTWLLEAIDVLVHEHKPYLIKDIRLTVQKARVAGGDTLDDHFSNQWISKSLRTFGFKNGPRTREGRTVMMSREKVDTLLTKYSLSPSPTQKNVTSVTTSTIESKLNGDTTGDSTRDGSEISVDEELPEEVRSLLL